MIYVILISMNSDLGSLYRMSYSPYGTLCRDFLKQTYLQQKNSKKVSYFLIKMTLMMISYCGIRKLPDKKESLKIIDLPLLGKDVIKYLVSTCLIQAIPLLHFFNQ